MSDNALGAVCLISIAVMYIGIAWADAWAERRRDHHDRHNDSEH